MKLYHFIKDNQRFGPMPIEQLMQYGLQPSTLVWTEGLTDWVTADQVAELQPLFAPQQPVAPVAPAPQAQPVAPEATVQPMAPAQPAAPEATVQPAAPQPQYQQPQAAPQYQQPQAAPQPQYQQPQAAPQYQQPQAAPQPQYQQPAQPQYQQPYQQPAAGGQNLQNIFKIILYILLGLSALGGLLNFIGAFSYFGGFLSMPLLGICQLLSSAAIIGISVIAIMRMVKNEKYSFLTIAYFALAFLLNLIGLIISSKYGGGVFSFIVGLAGLAIAVLASIPTDKIGDVNSYKNLLSEATQIDYILLGVYALFSLISLIYLISVLHRLNSFLM